MRAVIQAVVEAEAEAKRIVSAARASADEIAQVARQRALDLRARSRAAAQQAAEALVASALSAAERERCLELERADDALNAEALPDSMTRTRIVEAAVQCLVASERAARPESDSGARLD